MCATLQTSITPQPVAGTHWRLLYVHYTSLMRRSIHSIHVHPFQFPSKDLASDAQFAYRRSLQGLPRVTGVNGGQTLLVECDRGEDPLERVRTEARKHRQS